MKCKILIEAELKEDRGTYTIVLPDFSKEVIVQISNEKFR